MEMSENKTLPYRRRVGANQDEEVVESPLTRRGGQGSLGNSFIGDRVREQCSHNPHISMKNSHHIEKLRIL